MRLGDNSLLDNETAVESDGSQTALVNGHKNETYKKLYHWFSDATCNVLPIEGIDGIEIFQDCAPLGRTTQCRRLFSVALDIAEEFLWQLIEKGGCHFAGVIGLPRGTRCSQPEA